METPAACEACRGSDAVGAGLVMAFQPIVDLEHKSVYAHEALVRGMHGEGAAEILGRVDASGRYAFDQACRVRALECASQAGLPGMVSINFLPNAVYDPAHCLRATLAAAERASCPLSRIIFEVTEHEEITDHRHLLAILEAYKARGFKTAIDDFGAGYAGLNLLADFQPDLLKLDIGLVRNVHRDGVRRRLVAHTVRMCEDIGVEVIAEGVEEADEAMALFDLGIRLQQGFLFARPALPPLSEAFFPIR